MMLTWQGIATFHEQEVEEDLMDGAIPIEVSVLCVLRREKNSRYRLLLVV
jgi:hypothetical protein